MKRFALALVLGTVAYGVFKLHKAIAPCRAAANEWDKEYSDYSDGCSGIVSFKLRNYSLIIEDQNFVILERTDIPEYDPEWVSDGLAEIDIEAKAMNPTHIGEQAKFAAKYSMSKLKLDSKTDKEIKILGIAYFEKSRNFTTKELELIKKALVYRLANV